MRKKSPNKRIKRANHKENFRYRGLKNVTGFLFVVFVITVLIGGYLLYRQKYNNFIKIYNNYKPAFAPGDINSEYRTLSEKRSFNVLLIGLDQKESGHIKSDAVFVIHYDSVSEHFQVFELPTKVAYYWPDRNYYVELSNVYALGQLESPASGYSNLQDILEYNLAITIDSYVAVDLTGFEELLSGIGNLTVYNENSFTDEDLLSFGLRSYFDSGNLSLSSEDVVAFVRADEGGYFSKSNRHYKIIQSLVDSISVSKAYKTIGSFEEINKHVYSNLEGNSIRHFIKLFSNDNSFAINSYPLDSVLSKKENIEGNVFDVTKFDEFVSTTFNNSEVVREQARIEVYNSTNISGLASKYTRVLENMGCDIIRKSNTSSDVSETIIFAENPDLFPLTIAQIKNALEIKSSVVIDSPDFVTTGDLIIILAEDVESI